MAGSLIMFILSKMAHKFNLFITAYYRANPYETPTVLICWCTITPHNWLWNIIILSRNMIQIFDNFLWVTYHLSWYALYCAHQYPYSSIIASPLRLLYLIKYCLSSGRNAVDISNDTGRRLQTRHCLWSLLHRLLHVPPNSSLFFYHLHGFLVLNFHCLRLDLLSFGILSKDRLRFRH